MLDNLRLYQVLNLKRTDASPEDIKRAYRKTAARVHPDRNPGDPDSTSKFQDVQYAYSVLSDPQLRGVYDSYGEQGLKMYESYMSFADSNSSEAGPGLPLGNPAQLLMVLCCALSVVVGLFTTQCILLYLKLQSDSYATTPLALTLIPLWIIEAVLLTGGYAYLVSGVRKGAGSEGLLGAAGMLAQTVLVLACQILLSVRLDGVASTLSFAVVFSPLYALEAINFLKAGFRLTPTAYEAEKAAGATLLPYGLHIAQTIAGPIARAATLVLLTLHFDGRIEDSSWAFLLLPLWLLLAFTLMVACASLRTVPTNEREQMVLVVARGRMMATLFVALLLLFANLRLDGAIDTWLPIFIFFFIFSGCFFCCCCCAVCVLQAVPKSSAQDVPNSDQYTYGERAGAQRSDANDCAPQRASSESPPSENAPLLPGGGTYRTPDGSA